MIYDGMPYDPIQGQGQGHRGLKYAIMAGYRPSVCMQSKD